MSEKLTWNGSPPFGRRRTLIATLNLLAERMTAPQIIVEVGTSEAYSPDGLGNALLAFGWYARQMQARIEAVDIREDAVRNSGAILREYCPDAIQRVSFHRQDAFEYAADVLNPQHPSHLKQIDLVYYDAPSEPQSWYVGLHNKWADRFKAGALALFDDTLPTPPWNGKGAELIPHLLTIGWVQIPIDGEPVFPMVLMEKK